MKNVIGIKFMHTDQHGRRRTYHFRNDTGFKVSKGDQVIVLNHQGREEIVEVYTTKVKSYQLIRGIELKPIVGVFPPRTKVKPVLKHTFLPDV